MSVTRRDFLAGAAGAGMGIGLGGVSHWFPLSSPEVGPDWRPGDESFVPSTCLLCPAHCGILARRVDGMVSRIDGNPLHPVSRGGLCAKGRAGVQLLYHPGRIRTPLERIGEPGSNSLRPISWDEALERVSGALGAAVRDGSASDVRWITGSCDGLMADVVAGFAQAAGSRLTVDDYRDGSAEILRLCQGIDQPPAFDLVSSDYVLSFGAALAEAWWAPSMAAAMRDREPGAGPRWVQADVRLSRSAAAADQWVPVRPGSFGSLALGLAYFLLKEGAYDSDMVSRRVFGWDDWTSPSGERHTGYRRLVLRHGRPEEVSARTGVPVTEMVALAKALATANRPVALWDQAVSWRNGGLADAMAIHALNIILGSLNRPGGVLVQPSLPGQETRASAERPDLTSGEWPLAAAGTGSAPAPLVFLYKSNPVASSAEPDRVRQALDQAGLVVSFTPFLDESARYADLILPDHTYLERWQDATAPPAVTFPVWGVVQPATEPLHDTRATGDVILDLASRVGGACAAWRPAPSMEAMVRTRLTTMAAARRGSAFVGRFRQEELRELESRGWWLPHGKSDSDYAGTILSAGGWFDPLYDYHDRSTMTQRADGKVWIFPEEARRLLAAESADDSFVPFQASEDADDGEYPLELIPYRVLTLAAGSTPLMPWLLEHLGVLSDSAWEAWVELNPSTASEFHVRQGQLVRVESDHGAFQAVARLSEGAQPGVVNAPYGLHSTVEGWGVPRGANPLLAVGRCSDPVTGLPDWYSARVRIVPLDGGA